MNYAELLRFLAPETLVVVAALGVLLFDVTTMRGEPLEARMRWAAWPLPKVPFPAGTTGQLAKTNWRGVEVDTIVATVRQPGGPMRIHTMQVPLRPMAIQISVGGPESRSDEIARLAATVLASVEGETNW